jgi:hypothetical protein
MKYTVAMASDDVIHIPSFVVNGSAIQEILRFCHRNLKGCNIDTADGRYLGSMPLKWAQVT